MKAHENTPVLKLVPAKAIRFHEHPERQRTLRLVKRLQEEKFLRNPPIVARLQESQYVLLDGANRVSAFVEIGLSHVPVQVIDYGASKVLLKGWHHLLVGGKNLQLREIYSKIQGTRLQKVESSDLEELLELRHVNAVLIDEDGRYWGVFPETSEQPFRLHTWMSVLEQVIAGFEGKTKLERIKLADYSDLPDAFHSVDHQLVLYPTLTKFELLDLVRAAVMIPTGITRHLIPGRTLGLNLDLKFLTSLESEQEKLQHFNEFINRVEMEGRIRFYEESLFIMNE